MPPKSKYMQNSHLIPHPFTHCRANLIYPSDLPFEKQRNQMGNKNVGDQRSKLWRIKKHFYIMCQILGILMYYIIIFFIFIFVFICIVDIKKIPNKSGWCVLFNNILKFDILKFLFLFC